MLVASLEVMKWFVGLRECGVCRFRTQLCKDGNKCRRPVCFFSHSLTELRSPTHTWTPTPEDLKNIPPAVATDPPAEGSTEKKPTEGEHNKTETEKTDEKPTDLTSLQSHLKHALESGCR